MDRMVLKKRIAAELECLIHRHTCRGGDSVDDLAGSIGIGRKALDHRMHNAGDPTPLAVHELIALTALLEDYSLIQFVCGRLGGAFVPLPHEEGETRPAACWVYAMELAATAARETGEGLSISLNVLRERVATPEEKARVTREIHEGITALGQLLSAVTSLPERDNGRAATLGAMR